MASRQRINLMLNLVERKKDSADHSFQEQEIQKKIERFDTTSKPRCLNNSNIEKFDYNTSKPGCSKDADLEFANITISSFQNNNEEMLTSDSSDSQLNTEIQNIIMNISPAKSSNENNKDCTSSTHFTDRDETFLVCFDILSTLIDCLPCFGDDYGSSSSDEYIPDSNASSDSEYNIRRRQMTNRPIVVINDSDSDGNSVSFWAKEGIKEGRKRKPRKSEKERRIEREARKKKRNTGKSYKTNKGKDVRARTFTPLEACRMKCAEKIPEEFRKRIFDVYWGLGEYNERVQFISKLIELKKKNKHANS